MDLLELNKILSGDYSGCAEIKKPIPKIEVSDVTEFLSVFSVDEYIKSVFDSTENYKQFFEAVPWIKECFETGKAKELFYAAKNGILYDGVPPTVVFLFKKALSTWEYKYVNLALSRIEKKMLTPYLKSGVLPDDVTYKDVLDNLIGKTCKLITSGNPRVDVEGVTELYVPNIDMVALVPTEMITDLTDLSDLNAVEYDKVLGLTVKGQPIRIMAGRVGLTKNDLDLRNCL